MTWYHFFRCLIEFEKVGGGRVKPITPKNPRHNPARSLWGIIIERSHQQRHPQQHPCDQASPPTLHTTPSPTASMTPTPGNNPQNIVITHPWTWSENLSVNWFGDDLSFKMQVDGHKQTNWIHPHTGIQICFLVVFCCLGIQICHCHILLLSMWRILKQIQAKLHPPIFFSHVMTDLIGTNGRHKTTNDTLTSDVTSHL